MEIRKFNEHYEEHIRFILRDNYGEHACRDKLKREIIEPNCRHGYEYPHGFDGRLRVTYLWESGHKDVHIVAPPGWTMSKFTPQYEELLRIKTNPNGRGNAAYNVDDWNKMQPQDRLVRETTHDMPCGGKSIEIHWEAGRQDVLILPLNPDNAKGADNG